jgi:hypothetical protein
MSRWTNGQAGYSFRSNQNSANELIKSLSTAHAGLLGLLDLGVTWTYNCTDNSEFHWWGKQAELLLVFDRALGVEGDHTGRARYRTEVDKRASNHSWICELPVPPELLPSPGDAHTCIVLMICTFFIELIPAPTCMSCHVGRLFHHQLCRTKLLHGNLGGV